MRNINLQSASYSIDWLPNLSFISSMKQLAPNVGHDLQIHQDM